MSPALVNCNEYKPGARFYLAANLKYAADFPKSILKPPLIVKKSVGRRLLKLRVIDVWKLDGFFCCLSSTIDE